MPLNTWNSTKVPFPSSAGLATNKLRWRASWRPRFSKPSKQSKNLTEKNVSNYAIIWNFLFSGEHPALRHLLQKGKPKADPKNSTATEPSKKKPSGLSTIPKFVPKFTRMALSLVTGGKWGNAFKKFSFFLKVEFDLLQEFFVCRPRSDLENIEAFEEKRKQIWVKEKKGWCFS